MAADIRTMAIALAVGLALAGGGCKADGGAGRDAVVPAGMAALTITSANGDHRFVVEIADTAEKQERGLMFRTDIPKDGGMVFAPYPPDGSAPREASFWMKNTPSSLDIVFIRPDGTIATIAENTVPFSEMPIPSGEPVKAVLEIRGGRAAELGIAAGDAVRWRR